MSPEIQNRGTNGPKIGHLSAKNLRKTNYSSPEIFSSTGNFFKPILNVSILSHPPTPTDFAREHRALQQPATGFLHALLLFQSLEGCYKVLVLVFDSDCFFLM